jgi:hypothetical protein
MNKKYSKEFYTFLEKRNILEFMRRIWVEKGIVEAVGLRICCFKKN